jgi:hypothetical protein
MALMTMANKVLGWLADGLGWCSFMAFGSAAPEIIVNAVSTIKAAGATGGGNSEATSLGVRRAAIARRNQPRSLSPTLGSKAWRVPTAWPR